MPSIEKLRGKTDCFIKLIVLRDIYRDGWIPDWNDHDVKFAIYNNSNKIDITTQINHVRFLSFQTKEIRDEFLTNFRCLIEIAKELI